MHKNNHDSKNFSSSPRLFTAEEDVLCFASGEKLLKRKNAWISFFDEYQHVSFCFHSSTVQALDFMFEKNDLIKEQTAIEFELSKSFYCSIFELKKEMYLSNITAAHKLLYLSLIFGKYPGMFRRSIKHFFDDLEGLLSEGLFDELFEHVLIRFEIPYYLIQNFHFLNSVELDVLMHALNGKNMRNHDVFPIKPTKKEFSKIMQLRADALCFKDHQFLRGLVFVQMWEVELASEVDDESFLTRENWIANFLKASPTFLYNPNNYIKDIGFWKKGYQLITESISEGANLTTTDCVDYLEYMKYHSAENFRLKGRTKESLSRAILIWHNRVFNQDHAVFRELKWVRTDELDLYFIFNERDYACVQLTTGKELIKEGKFMQNCVLTYANSCANRHCTIWSMRKKRKTKFYSFLTVEVIEEQVVQVRQKDNELPSVKQLDVVQDWAKRMNYKIDLYKNE